MAEFIGRSRPRWGYLPTTVKFGSDRIPAEARQVNRTIVWVVGAPEQRGMDFHGSFMAHATGSANVTPFLPQLRDLPP
jgi:hypothetical protein